MRHARGTMLSSSGLRTGSGSPWRIPSSRSSSAPASSAASAAAPAGDALAVLRRLTREPGYVAGADDHGVDARALELRHLLGVRDRGARDRELPRGDVEQQAEHVLEGPLVVPRGREQEDLGVDAVERELELVLVVHLDDAVEPEVERLRVQVLEPAVVVVEPRDDEQRRVGARLLRLR